MPVLNWYIQNAAASGSAFGTLTETAQSAALTATGWTVGKSSAGTTSEMDWGVKRAASTFTVTSDLAASLGPDNTLGNGLRTDSAYSGVFAAGTWAFNFQFRPSTASTHTGRIRLRVWKSSSATGTSPTEITSGVVSAAATSSVFSSTATTVTSTVSWSAPQFLLDNEYLFVELEFQIDTAGSANNADVLVYTGAVNVTTTSIDPFLYLNATEAEDTASIALSARHTAALAASEDPDTASIAANRYFINEGFEPTAFENTAFQYRALVNIIALGATEAADTAAIAVSSRHTATLAATEVRDAAAIAGANFHAVSLAATETRDAAAIVAINAVTAALAATEAFDAAAIVAAAVPKIDLAATEDFDTSAIAVSAYHDATLAASEAADTAAFTASAAWTAALAVSESADTFTGLAAMPSGLNATWDSTKKATRIALSNNNYTATSTGGNAAQNGLVLSTKTADGSNYWEVQVTASALTGLWATGVADTAVTLSGNTLGSDTLSAGYYPHNGNVVYGGAVIGNIGTANVGDVISIAWDNINKSLWFRINGGFWNNEERGDPYWDQLGFNIPTLAGPYAAQYVGATTEIAYGLLDTNLYVYTAPLDFAGLISGALIIKPQTAKFTLSGKEARDTAAISLLPVRTATLAATEARDTAAINGANFWAASLAATEVRDTAALNSAVYWDTNLAATEARDTAALSGANYHTASLAATEALDTAAISGANFWAASLAATEARDTAAINANVLNGLAVTVAATEARDTAALAVSSFHTAALSATEARDTASGSLTAFHTATVTATEARDTAFIEANRLISLVTEAGTLTVTGYASTVNRIKRALADGGSYFVTGRAVDLYKSSFTYGDTEIVYVPADVNTIVIAPQYLLEETVSVPAAAKAVSVYFENRLISVPPKEAIEELAEYREVIAESRKRA